MRQLKVTGVILGALCVGTLAAVWFAPTVDGQEGLSPTMLMRKIIPRSQFSIENLVAIGKNEAKKRGGFVCLWFFTSDEDAGEFWSEKWTTFMDYQMWLKPYQRLSARPWNVARFVAWRDSAVFNMRDRDGNVIRRVVYGKDFLSMQAGGVFVDVVGFGQTGPNEELERPYFTVFARSRSGLSPRAAQLVWDEFRGVRASMVFVILRRDPWFIPQTGFQVFDPFESKLPPPRQSEAEQLPYLACSGAPEERAPSCSLMNENFVLDDDGRLAHP
jgi:hypothetical protein